MLSNLFCTLAHSESLALLRAYGTLESVPNKVRMAQYAAEVTLSEHSEILKRTKILPKSQRHRTRSGGQSTEFGALPYARGPCFHEIQTIGSI
jgi:hypothetical protein